MPHNLSFFERLILVVTFLGIFVTGSVLDSLGLFYTDIADAGDVVTGLKIHPYSIVLIASLLAMILSGQVKLVASYLRRHRPMMLGVAAMLTASVVSFLNTGGKGIGFFVDTIWAAILIDFFYEQSSERVASSLKLLVLSFVFLETVLALIEAAFSFNLIPIQITYGSYFRATALHGHPLNNALVVIAVYLTAMQFFSNAISFGIYSAGIFSLFSFGARSALVLFIVSGFVVLFQRSKKSKIVRLNLIIFGPLVTIGFALIAIYFGLAERIVAESFFDDSAYSRLDALSLLQSMTFSELLWGADAPARVDIMAINGLAVIENFWIVYIFSFGLIVGSLIIVALVSLFVHLLRLSPNVKFSERLVLLLTFLVTASTNNSLATKTSALMLFIIIYRIWLSDMRRINSQIT